MTIIPSGSKAVEDPRPQKGMRRVDTHGFYPEHDMEIKFDVEFDLHDINLINKCRCVSQQLLVILSQVNC